MKHAVPGTGLFVYLLAMAAAGDAVAVERSSVTLHEGWTLRQVGREESYPAKVPGLVHLDLFQNGLIGDPFYRDNEKGLQWIGKTDWEYRVFAKGANWIPADSFLTRLTRERYASLLRSARDAHMNMLRVWGGGIYESDDFYELADEMGLLVWQDFHFSCSLYPADQAFLASVAVEAEEAIRRLRNHPSIALWNGNNEIEAAWFQWGWKERYPAWLWNDYKAIFHDLLPKAVAKHDPTRPYWPSSPSANLEAPPGDAGNGDMHYFAPPKDMALVKAPIAVEVTPADGGLRVSLASPTLARHVRLAYDGDDGTFSDNYFDLLPGRPVEVGYRPKGTVEAAAFRKGLEVVSILDAY